MRTEAQLDHDHLWHPFTQQRDWVEEEPLVIERGEGTELIDDEGRRYLDGVSSLWCNVHGHRHPADRRGRSATSSTGSRTRPCSGSPTRAPAELAARLVELAPPGLTRVFYSDSGSTAVEVALKMAFQYWQQRGGQHARRTIRLPRDAYHGDTIGSVSVGGIDLFHSAYGPLLFESHAGRARRHRRAGADPGGRTRRRSRR